MQRRHGGTGPLAVVRCRANSSGEHQARLTVAASADGRGDGRTAGIARGTTGVSEDGRV